MLKSIQMKNYFFLTSIIFFSFFSRAQITTNSQWTWIKGDSTPSEGTYLHEPAARYGSVSWTDRSGKLWLFGGRGYRESTNSFWNNLDDLWKFDPSTNEWTWLKDGLAAYGQYGIQGVPSPNNNPPQRFGSISWSDNSGNLWLFGGGNYYPIQGIIDDFNDLWKYDINTNQWTWVKGDDTYDVEGVYGTQGIPSPLNKPGARTGSVSWTDTSGNLWLFGGDFVYTDFIGNFYENGPFNDLWKYDPVTNLWTWMKGDNNNNSFGIYGTKGTAAATNKPGARKNSHSWTDLAGNLWLFGGNGNANSGGGELNDLWRYNPVTNEWTWIKGDSTEKVSGIYGEQGITATDNAPGAREGAISWTDAAGNLWLFGGSGYAASRFGSLSDLWEFSSITNQWTWMKGDSITNVNSMYGVQGITAPTNNPGARYEAISWKDGAGNFWLFGGGFHNDLWKLTDASTLPVVLLSISATFIQTGVRVNWQTAHEINPDYYIVERSPDAISFTPIGRQQPRSNSSSTKSYSFIDTALHQGSNYYRIKMIEKDGSFTYQH